MLNRVFEVVDLGDADEVLQLVQTVFSREPARLAHVLTVANQVRATAQQLAGGSGTPDVDLAYRSALLHDIGYAEALYETGFHPIDGAQYLRRRGYADIADLIICHSNSPEQALLRGLPAISVSRHLIADIITYWDVQVAQGGQLVTYTERMADIRSRYGDESPVWEAHKQAEPRINAILDHINGLITRVSVGV
jgi:putative nucleotidyltransferase with HDIG domain